MKEQKQLVPVTKQELEQVSGGGDRPCGGYTPWSKPCVPRPRRPRPRPDRRSR